METPIIFGKLFTAHMVLLLVLSLNVPPLFGAGRNIMNPRVPHDQLEEARALKSPLPASSDVAAKGKEIYEGKGTCINCHGMTGRGDGPGGSTLNPSPRDFRHRGMWHHRTEGEIFWVIKNGIQGTGMIPFGGLLSDEEIWTVMQYERSFSSGHDRKGMGRHRGKGGMRQSEGWRGRGRHGGRDSGEPHGGMGKEECCKESD